MTPYLQISSTSCTDIILVCRWECQISARLSMVHARYRSPLMNRTELLVERPGIVLLVRIRIIAEGFDIVLKGRPARVTAARGNRDFFQASSATVCGGTRLTYNGAQPFSDLVPRLRPWTGPCPPPADHLDCRARPFVGTAAPWQVSGFRCARLSSRRSKWKLGHPSLLARSLRRYECDRHIAPSEVVADATHLKKMGRNGTGLCPPASRC
jgi:hypothetical protein